MAARDLPDLIVLDIVMPGMSGFAVLRALRREPATSAIPVIMISGNLKATEQFYGERIGADDFIRKPFGRAEVMASIQRLIDSGRLPSHRIDNGAGRADADESVPADNGDGPEMLLLDDPPGQATPAGPAAGEGEPPSASTPGPATPAGGPYNRRLRASRCIGGAQPRTAAAAQAMATGLPADGRQRRRRRHGCPPGTERRRNSMASPGPDHRDNGQWQRPWRCRHGDEAVVTADIIARGPHRNCATRPDAMDAAALAVVGHGI